jgi:hypothetical protein
MTNIQQRKYALIKIKAGDYVFPSNDKRTVIRVKQYIQMHEHFDLDKGYVTESRTEWEICTKRLFLLSESLGEDVPDSFQFGADWLEEGWETWDTGFSSRKAALASAAKGGLVAGKEA